MAPLRVHPGSLRLPPVSDTASGMPCPSTRTWCLLPGRARSTGLGPLLGRRAARTWLESITARDQSNCFAARSLDSRTACRRSHTPASFHAARRRQQVIPEPKPSSWGRYSHWIPVCSTNRIPHRACRLGTRGRPATGLGVGFGSNGSISGHSSRRPPLPPSGTCPRRCSADGLPERRRLADRPDPSWKALVPAPAQTGGHVQASRNPPGRSPNTPTVKPATAPPDRVPAGRSRLCGGEGLFGQVAGRDGR